MSYNLAKRLANIQRDSESEDLGRIRFGRALFYCCMILGLLLYGFEKSGMGSAGDRPEIRFKQEEAKNVKKVGQADSYGEDWRKMIKASVMERVDWLDASWFGSSAADRYLAFAQWSVGVFGGEVAQRDQSGNEGFFDLTNIWIGFRRGLAQTILRIGFALLIFWPLWLVSGAVCFGVARTRAKPKPTTDLLGVCDPGKSPFYSGIWGPLKPNSGISGTDFSCPSLACPAMIKKQDAVNHELFRTLRKYGASNETNLDLVRIVLAYKNYPAFVDDERPPDEATATETEMVVLSSSGIYSNADGNLEQGTIEGLRGVLEAHVALTRYYRTHQKGKEANLEAQFGRVQNDLEKIGKRLTPLGKILLQALTPERGMAIAEFSPKVVASAYLALEAGKSLVYDKVEGGFSRVSRFPHLQSRAVIQSLVSYHKEYDGDTRLMIREALICSRAHGDFGRPFLPESMPVPARALRDWLEILYAMPPKRQDAAYLAELNSHIEEFHFNFRDRLGERLRSSENQGTDAPRLKPLISLGFDFKSVIMMPLHILVGTVLQGISTERLTRVMKLIELTRKLQAGIHISARLPGFKRQAEEAEKGSLESGGVTQRLALEESGAQLVEKWLIVRRMLTRYNWLSTRVGDDAVPLDGLMQGVLIDRTGESAIVVGLDAVVPLRHRRFREIFGQQWERTYYSHSPHPNDIEVFANAAEFEKRLTERHKQERDGTLEHNSDSSGFAVGS